MTKRVRRSQQFQLRSMLAVQQQKRLCRQFVDVNINAQDTIKC